MAAIATWSFGLEAVKVASSVLEEGRSCIDAVETAISKVEDDLSTGVYLVGRGGFPNRDGILQLDAAIMRGRDCGIGSICSIECCPKPISVARHVLEHSSANLLVGSGATNYARQNGFQTEASAELLSDASREAYKKYKEGESLGGSSRFHDTLSVLCLDENRDICAGVSTSGMPFKPPGRVGDSPLPGCGYYADNKAGAAAATGDGECIMKYCPSYKLVDLMSQGLDPQKACEKVVTDMMDRNGYRFEVGLIALDMEGNFGACGTVKEWTDTLGGVTYKGFPYAVWRRKDQSPPSVLTYTNSDKVEKLVKPVTGMAVSPGYDCNDKRDFTDKLENGEVENECKECKGNDDQRGRKQKRKRKRRKRSSKLGEKGKKKSITITIALPRIENRETRAITLKMKLKTTKTMITTVDWKERNFHYDCFEDDGDCSDYSEDEISIYDIEGEVEMCDDYWSSEEDTSTTYSDWSYHYESDSNDTWTS